MASEKTPALLIPQKQYDEKKPKTQSCSKSFVSWVLAALLIALIVALCVQFLYPVMERRVQTDVDTVHIFRGTPVDVRTLPRESRKDELSNPQWHLDFLINPTRLCDTLKDPDSENYRNDPEVKLLVLVPSAISHFSQRRTIRRTWGSVADHPHGPMRLGFVLGTTTNNTEQDLIQYESEVFGDIIQADFLDTYRNLTTKSVLMLKWVSKHCAHAQYFLKADDDTFVNLDVLTNLLQKPPFAQEDKFIGGFIHKGAQPSRAPTEKYYVSEGDYPDDEYPPYASGSAYVTTGPTASQLFEAAKNIKPFLPMEDVFITGLCADEIAATLIHEPSFRYVEPPDPLNWDHYSSLATAHSVSPDDMDLLWDQMTRHFFDILFPDSSSSSDSSEWFDKKTMLEMFNWPSDSKSSSESSSSSSNSLTDKLKSLQALNLQSNEVNTDSLKENDDFYGFPFWRPKFLDDFFKNSGENSKSSSKAPESQTSDSNMWPSFPFFPFVGSGKPGDNQRINITYFVLK